jgi:predicted ester cyclase
LRGRRKTRERQEVFEMTEKKSAREAQAQHLVGMAHRFAQTLNEKNVEMLDDLLGEIYVNHNPYVEDGREANKQFWSYWLGAFPDTEVIVEDAFASEAGDRVVGRFTYRATHNGEFMGAEPTGRPVEMRSIDIWRVERGRFVEHWDELNALELFGQLGLVPIDGEEGYAHEGEKGV